MTAHHKYGWKKDKVDPRDLVHTFAVSRTQSTIKMVDLRKQCPPVYDQGSLGSCHDNITEVLTNNGWKLFTDVGENDKLASVDPV